MNKIYEYAYEKEKLGDVFLEDIIGYNKISQKSIKENYIIIINSILINGCTYIDKRGAIGFIDSLSTRKYYRKNKSSFIDYKIFYKNNNIIIQTYLYKKKDIINKINIKKLFQIIFGIDKSKQLKNKNLRSRYIDVKKRIYIFERDKYTCQYCGWKNGTKKGDRVLHIDHKIPVYFGGTNKVNNLLTACYKCNISKNNKIIEWENY